MPDDGILQQSSAQSVASYIPENPLSFNQWVKENDANSFLKGDNSSWSRVFRFFDGSNSVNKNNYEAYLAALENRNEARALQSARDWDLYMNSTRYQREMKDLEAAGLNPYLLVSGGSLSPGGTTNSANQPGYSQRGHNIASEPDAKVLTAVLAALVSVAAASAKAGATVAAANTVRKNISYRR